MPVLFMADWYALGLDAPTNDLAAIKRAYALKLRVTRPDDDAQAYQALREAYDRALYWARHPGARESAEEEADEAGPVGQDMAPPRAEGHTAPEQTPDLPPEPPPAHAPVPAMSPPAPSPAEWCERITRIRQERAHNDVVALPARLSALLPELMRDLSALPLQMHAEASVRFAELVINLAPLPATFLKPLQEHFGWLDDFRTARLMGPGRHEALAQALSEVPRPITDPHILHAHADCLAINRLLSLKSAWRGKLAATLMGHQLPRQFAGISSALRPRLGIGALECWQIERALSLGHGLRTAATIAALLALHLLLGMPLATAMKATVGASVVALVGLGLFMKGFEILQSLHNKLSWPAWWGLPPLGLAAACAAIGEPALGFIATVLGIGGLVLALPRSFDQVFGVTALLLYLAAALHPAPHAELALATLWVLGSQQLYGQRRLTPLIRAVRQPGRRQAPLRAAAAIAAWPLIIIPVFVCWVAETLSFRLVFTALFLAMGFSVHAIGQPDLPIPLVLLAFPAMLFILLGVQAQAFRLGRKWAGTAVSE